MRETLFTACIYYKKVSERRIIYQLETVADFYYTKVNIEFIELSRDTYQFSLIISFFQHILAYKSKHSRLSQIIISENSHMTYIITALNDNFFSREYR